MIIKTAKELTVYQKSYELAMQIFEISQSFPREELFALTSQIRRSSRSVPMNLRDAWQDDHESVFFLNLELNHHSDTHYIQIEPPDIWSLTTVN